MIFMVVERHHLQFTEFQNFPGEHVPGAPEGSKALSPLPALCLGVNPSRPPVHNLNETPAVVGLFIQLYVTVSRLCCLLKFFSNRSSFYAKITLKRVRKY